jgi:L-threonylcarbamoyladenylate synthase
MELTKPQKQELHNAFSTLKKGGVILYPTDTIWGLGCDARKPEAIDRLMKLKGREEGKPLLILVDSMQMIMDYVEIFPQSALSLLHSAQKPTTLIYPHSKNLPPNLLPEDKSIGIRIVCHPFCTPLVKMLAAPITSTSANFSGNASPKSYDDIDPKLIKKVDYAVNPTLFTSNYGISSAIYKVMNDTKVICIRE